MIRAYSRPFPTLNSLMRIRIVRRLPAPLMDGFDVRGFSAGEEYDVEPRLGNYLIVAGYAVAHEDEREPGGHEPLSRR